MREIKLRGKRIDNGEWVYGSLITHISEAGEGVLHAYIEEVPSHWNTKHEEHFWEHRRWKVDPETVGQLTGLLDKNGKEIYEGDLVRFSSTYLGADFPTRIGEVFFKIEGSIDYCFKVPREGNFGLNSNDVQCYKVIGNIHESPEILHGIDPAYEEAKSAAESRVEGAK